MHNHGFDDHAIFTSFASGFQKMLDLRPYKSDRFSGYSVL